MKVTELEKLVIKSMLTDDELKPVKSIVSFDAVEAVDRELTGAGFLTDFGRSEELKVFDAGVPSRRVADPTRQCAGKSNCR